MSYLASPHLETETLIKRIIGGILTAIGLIVALFFQEYDGDLIPLSDLWFLLGLAMMAGGAYLTIPSLFKRRASEDNSFLKELEEFKKRADTRRVDLDTCEVRHSSYFEEQGTDEGLEYEVFSHYHPSYNSTPTYEKVNQVVLIWETTYQGVKRRFISPFLDKDETTVRFKMATAKNTTLYIDPENAENYFFDVSFLES